MANAQAKTEIGICIGRFQIDALHEGHKAILEACFAHPISIVFIGVAATPVTKTNPLDFITRKRMIDTFAADNKKNVIVLPATDHASDVAWSENIDKMIRMVAPFGKVTMYHSRDSFKDRYHGVCKNFVEVPTVGKHNATDIRNAIGATARGSSDFRAGAIYAAQNMYPRVQPTVDIAVIDLKAKKLLLGNKPGNPKLCFVGGFIDMTDENAEQAALRELQEETGIEIILDLDVKDPLKYIGTAKINDWRDTPSTSIITTFFALETTKDVMYKAADDLEKLAWYDINVDTLMKIQSCHQKLYSLLLKHYNILN